MNKSYVYQECEKICSLSNEKPIGFSTWYVIWNTYCKNIVIQKPKSDLCDVCQSSVLSISELSDLPKLEKERRLHESLMHLEIVKKERLYYNNVIQELFADLMKKFSNCIPLSLNDCVLNIKLHISFDFVQQIGIPLLSQQVGPLYSPSQYKLVFSMSPLSRLKDFIYSSSLNHALLQRFLKGGSRIPMDPHLVSRESANDHRIQINVLITCKTHVMLSISRIQNW